MPAMTAPLSLHALAERTADTFIDRAGNPATRERVIAAIESALREAVAASEARVQALAALIAEANDLLDRAPHSCNDEGDCRGCAWESERDLFVDRLAALGDVGAA